MIPGPKDVIGKAKSLVQRLFSGLKTGSPPPLPHEVVREATPPRLSMPNGPSEIMRGASIPKPPRPPGLN
jgi:hypothetical protein